MRLSCTNLTVLLKNSKFNPVVYGIALLGNLNPTRMVLVLIFLWIQLVTLQFLLIIYRTADQYVPSTISGSSSFHFIFLYTS